MRQLQMAGRTLRWGRTLLAAGLISLLAAPAAAAEERTVEDVMVTPGERTEVVVVLDREAQGAAVSSFTLTDPDRVVVDIADARVAPGAAQEVAGGGLVRSVEVESWDDGKGPVSRVTLVLTGPVQHEIRSEGARVRVLLSPAEPAAADPLAAALEVGAGQEAAGDVMAEALASAGAAEAAAGAQAIDTPAGPRPLSGPEHIDAPVAVRSLDFRNLDRVSRVLIGLKGTDRYSVARPQPRLIVVDVPGAFLPKSLRRVLDASRFVSPVRMVRAYPTSTGARVAITLRREADYEAHVVDGGLLAIDVAIPPDMREERAVARQDFSAVAPAEQGEGIRSAYQEELLIGSGGRTVSPQAAFGSGAGAGSPSALFGMAAGFMVDSSSATSAPYTGRRISLDFVNADIHNIFRLISHVSNLNIVASDDVKGTVTVRMVDVPWDQALAAILQAKGLGSQRFGNIIRVAPIETIKQEQQAALEAQRAKEELTELSLLVLPLNYTQAAELEDKVKALLSSRGEVQVDQTSNQLIIRETDERLAQIRELIRQLDRQTPQVLIEARVVEANSTYSKSLGIQWGATVDASTRTGYPTGLFFPNGIGVSGGVSDFYSATAGASDNLLVDLGADSATSGLAISLGSIPGLIDLDARLTAMETNGWGKVVSSPRVVTLDNKAAIIKQGARIPYLSTSAGGTNVQFVDAVLQLQVTPHITSDGQVFLKVNVKNDRADFSQLVQGQPAIIKKEAQTELLVGDGDTTVIGGVFATESSGNEDYVPFFGKIPILGALFRSSTEDVKRNELLVFITPRIINKPVTDE